jgi:hypothetical protein
MKMKKKANMAILACIALVFGGFYLFKGTSERHQLVQVDAMESETPDSSALDTGGQLRNVPNRVDAPKSHRNAPRQITEDWLAQQSPDVRASLLMGFNLHGYSSFAELFHALELEVANGDLSRVAVLAELSSRCRVIMTNRDALEDFTHALHDAAVSCSTLPDSDRTNISTLVEQAAAAGHSDAILAQFDYPRPPWSKDRNEWATSAAQRLENLAATGNADASLKLAKVFLSPEYGLRDIPRGVSVLKTMLKRVSKNDPRHFAATGLLNKTCKHDPIACEGS